jgi:hypothetical protein
MALMLKKQKSEINDWAQNWPRIPLNENRKTNNGLILVKDRGAGLERFAFNLKGKNALNS